MLDYVPDEETDEMDFMDFIRTKPEVRLDLLTIRSFHLTLFRGDLGC